MARSEEQVFLHDISNSLAVASGLVDALIDDSAGFENLTESQKRRLLKVQAALDKLRALLRDRQRRPK